jgi:hypothetical protein
MSIKALMKSAWLITWDFHSPDKNERLKECGIKNEIIDILDGRQTFDYVLDSIKHIYILLNGDIYNKFLFAKRSKNAREDREEYFRINLLHTSYQDKIYKELMEAFREKGIESEEYKKFSEKWVKYPAYISVGHNPSIYARKVYKLKLFINKDNIESLEWYEPLINGEQKKFTLVIK